MDHPFAGSSVIRSVFDPSSANTSSFMTESNASDTSNDDADTDAADDNTNVDTETKTNDYNDYE